MNSPQPLCPTGLGRRQRIRPIRGYQPNGLLPRILGGLLCCRGHGAERRQDELTYRHGLRYVGEPLRYLRSARGRIQNVRN